MATINKNDFFDHFNILYLRSLLLRIIIIIIIPRELVTLN